MKVVMVTADNRNAIFLYTVHLANGLSGLCDTVLLVPEGAQKTLVADTLTMREVKMGDTKRNAVKNTVLLSRTVSLLRAIRLEKPDVIHFQSGTNLWLSLLLPFLKKYPIITTIHDVQPHLGYERRDKDIAKAMHIKHSRALIVHGEKEKEALARMLAEKKLSRPISVLPHGEYSFYREMGTAVPEEDGTVLFFGHIAPYKGIDVLIEAAPLVLKEVKGARIVIAGKGDIGGLKEGTEAHFELHNRFIKDDEVAGFFSQASVVVLPYISGSQTGIIPIAYSFRKPVVVTDVGSIPEVVEDGRTGFVVPPGDSEALAKAIVSLLKDSRVRREMGEHAYRKMVDELSWDSIARRTVEIYHRVSGGNA